MLKRFLVFVSCICLLLAFIPSKGVEATNIRDLENQQSTVQQEIDSYEGQMVELMAQISVLETEIAQNQASISETEAELAEAQLAKADKYVQMCRRIKYNYEHKEESVFTLMLTADSFGEFLNRLEYANSIFEYDSDMIDTYDALCADIEAIQIDLMTRKAELDTSKAQLSQKRASLDSMIADARARKTDIDSQLTAAREEAARRAAEEAARRAAAAVTQRTSQVSGGNQNPAPRTGISGYDVVAYANQFVGNRYVWGGNSLTNGVDCSGFVVQVYKHFGIDLSGSRHTSLLEKVGQPVSYENLQAGDIVCYPGHVGIYTGNGTIVEAMNSANGITNWRSVGGRTITAIRRVI